MVNFDIKDYIQDPPDLTEIKKEIIANGNIPNSDIINEMLELTQLRRDAIVNNYKWYRGPGAPVFHRVFYGPDGKRLNVHNHRRIFHDMIGRVVRAKSGYMAGGDSVTVQLEKGRIVKGFKKITDKFTQQFEKLNQAIQDFIKINNLKDLRAETIKHMSTYGECGRLLFGNSQDGIRPMFIHGWEIVTMDNGKVVEPVCGFRIISENRIDYYNETIKIEYTSREEKNKVTTTAKTWIPGEQINHNIGACPLIPYVNNKERQGDCAKALSNINNIDEQVSNEATELTKSLLSLMLFIDLDVDKDKYAAAVSYGGIKFTTKDGKGDVRFLHKDIPYTATEQHVDRSAADVMKDCAHVDFTNATFAGAQSGEARKFYLFDMEAKCGFTENKYMSSELRMWQIITDFWARIGQGNGKGTVIINPLDIESIWTRNLPVSLESESRTFNNLFGRVPNKDAYKLLSIIKDPEKTSQEFDEETGRIPPEDNE